MCVIRVVRMCARSFHTNVACPPFLPSSTVDLQLRSARPWEAFGGAKWPNCYSNPVALHCLALHPLKRVPFSAFRGGVALQVASWKVSRYRGVSQLHCRLSRCSASLNGRWENRDAMVGRHTVDTLHPWSCQPWWAALMPVGRGQKINANFFLYKVLRQPFGSWTSAPKIVDVRTKKCLFLRPRWWGKTL